MSRHKKKKKWPKVLFIIFLIILAILGVFVGILYSKFSNLNIQDIDKNNLGINDDLYSRISSDITESEFKNIRNFVLFGIDTQSAGDGQDEAGFIGRTDTIIIISINPKFKSIKLISIPRDTYAEVEGHGKTKINHAYAYGGAQLAIKTINENFNLNISEFITVDFAGLAHVINDIGGIDLYISNDEKNYINQYSYVTYNATGNEPQKLSSYGNINLDGEQAVTHARNRTIGDGDFERAKRQREVIEAMFTKISKMDAGEIYNLIDVIFKEITTNIDIPGYMGLIADILLNKSLYLNNIVSTQVPKQEYCEHKYIDGIYYFVPTDTDKMKEDMWDYMYKR